MKGSTERILTTHVGSLARADSLIPLLRLREQGQPYDREELARLVREAVADVVRQQVEAGIDIVTDGEQGKSSFYGYVVELFSGFERKPAAPGKEMRPRAAGREYLAFPDYYAWSERIAEPFGGRGGRGRRSRLRLCRLRPEVQRYPSQRGLAEVCRVGRGRPIGNRRAVELSYRRTPRPSVMVSGRIQTRGIRGSKKSRCKSPMVDSLAAQFKNQES